jgi:hypothetical protein
MIGTGGDVAHAVDAVHRQTLLIYGYSGGNSGHDTILKFSGRMRMSFAYSSRLVRRPGWCGSSPVIKYTLVAVEVLGVTESSQMHVNRV